jgi:ClpP class serine protease
MPMPRCDRVVSAIARQPWAITLEGLELVLGIAQRRISDPQAVPAAPPERRESGNVKVRDGVAIISIMGPIFPRADCFTQISGATSIETLGMRFGEALSAEDVKAIVLHIDSSGGHVTGVHEFAAQIFAARDIKPVVAYISGTGTSAAYWIACAAQRVIADATAVLGSIGVVAVWTDDREARKSKGLIDYEVVSSQSPNKRLDPAGEEGRSVLQRHLDETADIFIADVARNRGKRAATVAEQFGRGGVMLAAEAVKVGMADAIGSLEGVMAELSGVDGATRTDRDQSITRINKEIPMDKAELAQKHPELLAQIQAEARAEAEESLKAAKKEYVVNIRAMVVAVAGEEAAVKLAQLAEAGITAKQIAALGSLIAMQSTSKTQTAPPAPEAGTESAGRKEVLALLRGATPAPVNTSVAPKGDDAVRAVIDQISAVNA